MFKIWVAFLLACSAVFADCFCKAEKAYVKPEQVAFEENAILINLHDLVLETNAIYSDKQGLYFIVDQENRDCKSPDWWCAFCKQCNAYWYSRCPKCLHWR